MTYNDDLRDAFIRYQILMQRYTRGQLRDVGSPFNKLDEETTALVLLMLDRGTTPDVMATLNKRLFDLRVPAYEQAYLSFSEEMANFSEYTAAHTARTLQVYTPVELNLSVPVRDLIKEEGRATRNTERLKERVASAEGTFERNQAREALRRETTRLKQVKEALKQDAAIKKQERDLVKQQLADVRLKGTGTVPLGNAGEGVLKPVKSMLIKDIETVPFQGRKLSDWFSKLAQDDIDRIMVQVQQGISQGEDVATIAKRITGTRAQAFADGALARNRASLETLVRTAISHHQNEAREAMYALNADIMTKVQFLATLDGKTSPICRSLDGKVYEISNKARPRPPLHPNCRSLVIPIIVDETIGQRPYRAVHEKQLRREFAEANPSVPKRGEIPRGFKTKYREFASTRTRELTGFNPQGDTYQTFLQKQPLSFQQDVLGVQKAKLFREGGLKLDRFVDETGREYSLKELKLKERDAFRKAGLE